jgi:hypothetical protein
MKASEQFQTVGETRILEAALTPGRGIPGPRQGSVGPRHAELAILSALWSENQPLTFRRLQLKTGIPPEELQMTITELCTARDLKRLNTVIESYLPAPAAEARGFRFPPGAAESAVGPGTLEALT